MCILRNLCLPRRGLNFPATGAIDGLFAEQPEIELVRIALLEVFEAEISAEKSRRAILQCDPPVPIERRRPHPLIRRAIRMIQHQQSNALNFSRGGESQHCFTRPMRADPVVLPSFFGDLIFRVNHPQCAFVALRLSHRPALSLFDNLPGVDLQQHERDIESGGENPTHTPAPLPSFHGLRLLRDRARQSMRLRG